ncbi:MAG: silent information regulator protein Sir2 [Spirochaetes bacterium GWD1_27_9]|nr:MAG: silent information regulator protein Sir2 [Spirochaetes bacterium GWB1_27_13]OHD21842.1 MAG: silent information regulator protein Sir2 [Spirochaetes bacterium GWC1_27_15]OHD30035.1 MAG: silent information regulator protein Sir2 [Spirochaetes bacterium GWD1_27_9]
MQEIINLFEKSNNIVVFTGAGISTNCGIPDFRGANGLYSFVAKKYNLPFPEAVFEINYFKENPKPFFDLSKEMVSAEIKPSLAHKFIAFLEEKCKISLVMTQNIDMLHQKAGNKKVVECHGTYSTATCLNCRQKYSLLNIEESLKKGEVPYCKCGGIIKPDIVFFGEQLPDNFFSAYRNPPKTDLLLVMGSSLTVQPAANFALSLAEKHKSILINFEKTYYDNMFTYVINEDIDIFCKKIWDNIKI